VVVVTPPWPWNGTAPQVSITPPHAWGAASYIIPLLQPPLVITGGKTVWLEDVVCLELLEMELQFKANARMREYVNW